MAITCCRYIFYVVIVLDFVSAAILDNCKCGDAFIEQDKVFGGRSVEVLDYPWIAYIEFSKVFFCGGVVLNDLYILTADHCLESIKNLKFAIYLMTGDRVHDKGSKNFPEKIIRHPRSPKLKNNDIGLIKLKKRLIFTNYFNPICLPAPSSTYTHLNVSVFGWGVTESGAASNILQKAQLTVMSDEYCSRSGLGKLYRRASMLCAFNYKSDACLGDSGGPLVYNPRSLRNPKYELVGLVSWGQRCASGLPGVYTKVTQFIDWIAENTKGANYCSY